MSQPRIAVLMSCHNRRNTTLSSLAAIYAQDIPGDIYLVDDGSSDGTSEAVRTSYPAVKILQGDGNLFWGGGMQLAFSTALKVGYDFYLWLNDDTKLAPNALSLLLNTYRNLAAQDRANCILAGSTQDPITGELTYGGMVRLSPLRRLNFSLLSPTNQPQECDTMCGNCVLIPHSVAKWVGTIDGDIFTHEFGDWDYGLRARALGFSVWIAPGFIGSCSNNSVKGSWKDSSLPLIERFKKADKLKGGLQPRVWMEFARRHAGVFWFIYWVSPYLRLVVASVFKSLEHPAVVTQK